MPSPTVAATGHVDVTRGSLESLWPRSGIRGHPDASTCQRHPWEEGQPRGWTPNHRDAADSHGIPRREGGRAPRASPANAGTPGAKPEFGRAIRQQSRGVWGRADCSGVAMFPLESGAFPTGGLRSADPLGGNGKCVSLQQALPLCADLFSESEQTAFPVRHFLLKLPFPSPPPVPTGSSAGLSPGRPHSQPFVRRTRNPGSRRCQPAVLASLPALLGLFGFFKAETGNLQLCPGGTAPCMTGREGLGRLWGPRGQVGLTAQMCWRVSTSLGPE